MVVGVCERLRPRIAGIGDIGAKADHQLVARDVGAAVGRRIRHAEALAQQIHELAQLDHGHLVGEPILPEQTRLDELGPRDVSGFGIQPDTGYCLPCRL